MTTFAINPKALARLARIPGWPDKRTLSRKRYRKQTRQWMRNPVKHWPPAAPVDRDLERMKGKELEAMGFAVVTLPDGRTEIACGVARGNPNAKMLILTEP